MKIEQPSMSPEAFRQAQQQLGLSDSELARMLGFSHDQHVRRLKAPVDKGHHKPVAGHTVRLLGAYLAGYRPDDWPGAS